MFDLRRKLWEPLLVHIWLELGLCDWQLTREQSRDIRFLISGDCGQSVVKLSWTFRKPAEIYVLTNCLLGCRNSPKWGSGNVGSEKKLSSIDGRGPRILRPPGITGICSARAQHGWKVTETLLKKIHLLPKGFSTFQFISWVTEAPIPTDNSSKISRSVRNVRCLSSYSFCRRHGWVYWVIQSDI